MEQQAQQKLPSCFWELLVVPLQHLIPEPYQCLQPLLLQRANELLGVKSSAGESLPSQVENLEATYAAELQRIVDDPVLVQFIFEDRRYKPDELVGIIKRISAWGQTTEESDA